jgi:hypothetical protein
VASIDNVLVSFNTAAQSQSKSRLSDAFFGILRIMDWNAHGRKMRSSKIQDLSRVVARLTRTKKENDKVRPAHVLHVPFGEMT